MQSCGADCGPGASFAAYGKKRKRPRCSPKRESERGRRTSPLCGIDSKLGRPGSVQQHNHILGCRQGVIVEINCSCSLEGSFSDVSRPILQVQISTHFEGFFKDYKICRSDFVNPATFGQHCGYIVLKVSLLHDCSAQIRRLSQRL